MPCDEIMSSKIRRNCDALSKSIFKTSVILIYLMTVLEPGHTHHENLCLGLPTGRRKSYTLNKTEKDRVRNDIWTVGSQHWYQEETQERWSGVGFGPDDVKDLHGALFPGEKFRTKDEFNKFTWIVKAFSIKPIKGDTLDGWIRIEISSTAPRDTHVVDRLAIVARGKSIDSTRKKRIWLSGVGEFTNDAPSCANNDMNYSPYQIVHCGGATPYDPGVGNGMIFIRRASSGSTNERSAEYGPLFPKGTDQVLANFRIGRTPCNYLGEINFRVIGVIKELKANDTARGSYYYTSQTKSVQITFNETSSWIPSAVHSQPTKSPVTWICTELLKGGDWSGQIKSVNQYPNVELLDTPKCYDDHACTPPIQTSRLGDNVIGEYLSGLFTGRCGNANSSKSKGTSKCDGSFDTVHQCYGGPQSPLNETYDKQLETIHGQFSPCCKFIPPRPFTTTPTPVKLAKPNDTESGVEVNSMPSTLALWDTRTYHGMVMTILTFLVLPVNGFFTRYFKETFMDVRIMYHRVWYMLHHQAAATAVTLMFLGLARIRNYHGLMGWSRTPEAKLHRLAGYGVAVVILFLFFFGGFRCLYGCVRETCIFVHFLLGATVYLGCLFCFAYSVYIPGSPSKSWKKIMLGICAVWIIFDVSMHLILTIQMCIIDSRIKLKRPRLYLPSPVPVLQEHFRFDFPGGLIRKIVLIIYVTMSVVVTVAICGMLWLTKLKGPSFGEMTCTHMKNGSFKVNATDCFK